MSEQEQQNEGETNAVFSLDADMSALRPSFSLTVDVSDAYDDPDDLRTPSALLETPGMTPTPQPARASIHTSTNIFIACLPSTWDEAKLRTSFGAYGEILSVKLEPRRHFAFVMYRTAAEASCAIATAHNKPCDNSPRSGVLHVSIAMHDEGADHLPNPRIFIRGLPPDSTKKQLLTAYGVFGTVVDAHFLTTPDNQSKGVAFVSFQSTEEAAAALAASDKPMTIGDRQVQLSVKYSETASVRQQRSERNKVRQRGSNFRPTQQNGSTPAGFSPNLLSMTAPPLFTVPSPQHQHMASAHHHHQHHMFFPMGMGTPTPVPQMPFPNMQDSMFPATPQQQQQQHTQPLALPPAPWQQQQQQAQTSVLSAPWQQQQAQPSVLSAPWAQQQAQVGILPPAPWPQPQQQAQPGVMAPVPWQQQQQQQAQPTVAASTLRNPFVNPAPADVQVRNVDSMPFPCLGDLFFTTTSPPLHEATLRLVLANYGSPSQIITFNGGLAVRMWDRRIHEPLVQQVSRGVMLSDGQVVSASLIS